MAERSARSRAAEQARKPRPGDADDDPAPEDTWGTCKGRCQSCFTRVFESDIATKDAVMRDGLYYCFDPVEKKIQCTPPETVEEASAGRDGRTSAGADC